MATSSSIRCQTGIFKRLKISHPRPLLPQTQRSMATINEGQSQQDAAVSLEVPETMDPQASRSLEDLPVPLPVRLTYLKPLKRTPTHGLPVCNLQLRSYTPRNLDFFADFALRAAYYLKLPAKGPVPLPRIIERWTVPRGNFVHKKSQENFERRTCRRLIQIQDGDPETVQLWLAYLEKRGYHGVGMKANTWEYEGLETMSRMEAEVKNLSEELRTSMTQEEGEDSVASKLENGKDS